MGTGANRNRNQNCEGIGRIECCRVFVLFFDNRNDRALLAACPKFSKEELYNMFLKKAFLKTLTNNGIISHIYFASTEIPLILIHQKSLIRFDAIECFAQ